MAASTLLVTWLDELAQTPLYGQLYSNLRVSVLDGTLPPGTRLPSTRALATTLNLSRNTVTRAFDQLLAEGYLEARAGAGTYVASTLPEDALHCLRPGNVERLGDGAQAAISARGRLIASSPASLVRSPTPARPFRPGVPALDLFPWSAWDRISRRVARQRRVELCEYGDPAGYRPLRERIADYVSAARGVQCSAERVIVVSGSQQALDLAARVLLDPGDPVWMEDPGYLGARGAFRAAGARIVPVPVDEHGLDVAAGVAREPTARLAYVSPSHQFPLGVSMPAKRRLALLEWATTRDAWIVEDDYDSQYRYTGRPPAALQSIDTYDRVIYVGTLSKMMFPALRLGFMVVPQQLVDPFVSARALVDRHSPILQQAMLSSFFESGDFARHVRRMRTEYKVRQDVVREAAGRELRGRLTIESAAAGMHLIAWLPNAMDDRAVCDAAARCQIDLQPISAYRLVPGRPGVIMGYAGYPPPVLRDAIHRLVKVF